ncbi:ABC transporter ATP-binding protein [Agrococcus sp. SGAir0287]|uniref:ABC transporter ATP-binding protein n=1 Tax=Agrococcus sp. SGAir0287 TaxID=2070347 RepID=UPI0010CCF45D|nr:ABC transporter ATP-binding protein [Agrococcus sp. SGAir0287]QCR18282.1 ABC transporter ATP-binding protein [Agrococcus sp. SGAir0287]
MTAVIETTRLSKHYPKGVRALDEVSIALEPNRIHALLGRNGAGKTTLMQLLTGQLVATSGDMRVLGEHPFENADVLSRTCFIQESQRYPDGYRPQDVLAIARTLHPQWDEDLEQRLVADFRLPVDRQIKKLSRGQLSAIGIVVGLASRAPVTFFDEPYLGLDAVARQLFYDHLLADFAEHPRTILLSTHLIDEVANLLEHVVVIDQGRVLVDADADELRGRAYDVSGRADALAGFLEGREVVAHQRLGGLANATVLGRIDDATRAALVAADLTTSPVSLQSLVVHLTRTPELADASA